MTDDLPLTAVELQTFETFYQRKLREIGSLTLIEELVAAQEIFATVIENGVTPLFENGSVTDCRRNAQKLHVTMEFASRFLIDETDDMEWFIRVERRKRRKKRKR